jgi:UDP-N-acetylglucosamine--N-acetylmuramyl-(pentapeptide) pyrophosphoryl-undecaprenol N-acetylglucosamine transferase
MNKRIIICGGGTAGHIYPAVAIIEEIIKRNNKVQVLFIGSKKGMEKDIASKLGVKFLSVNSTGLLQKASLCKKIKSYLSFLLNIFIGFFKSVKIIYNFKPNAVLGMGGYSCAPVLLACIFLRKKFYLHEQNYIPGRLNVFFSRFCTKIFISFKETENYFKIKKSKIIFSGNPVRKIIRNAKNNNKKYEKYGLQDKKFTITAFGGSLGADKINNTFLDFYEHFKTKQNYQFILISGRRFFENINSRYTEKGLNKHENFKIFPYVNEMDEIYNLSDLIISRSGANTVAEILICNIPSILIPYPNAINNHQYYNAKFLEENGKAILINDYELTVDTLIKIINDIVSNNFKIYNELKNRTVNDYFFNGHEIITNYLLGE